MAKPTLLLIRAIRNAAKNLHQSSAYQWGHMGSCNCGFLAQEITRLSKSEIHERAMMKQGDWTEQLNDYCPTSGLLMDDLITEMLEAGLDTDDLKHLERLSDPIVLQRFPESSRHLTHNLKIDVIAYMNMWANLIEDELTEQIEISDLNIVKTSGRYKKHNPSVHYSD